MEEKKNEVKLSYLMMKTKSHTLIIIFIKAGWAVSEYIADILVVHAIFIYKDLRNKIVHHRVYEWNNILNINTLKVFIIILNSDLLWI